MRNAWRGYAIGIAIGLSLGLATSTSGYMQDTVGALALGLQTLPSVCWVPLALLCFGQTETAMLFVVVMGTLWSVLLATETGAQYPTRSMRARPAPWDRKVWTNGRG